MQQSHPEDDPDFMEFVSAQKPKIDKPLAIADALAGVENGEYIAIFIAGGHGSILGLTHDQNVRRILEFVVKNKMKLVSICHGPAVFSSVADGVFDEDYPFRDYTIVCFPDGVDRQLPRYGYLPGKMPWYYGKKLKALGVDIANKSSQDAPIWTGM